MGFPLHCAFELDLGGVHKKQIMMASVILYKSDAWYTNVLNSWVLGTGYYVAFHLDSDIHCIQGLYPEKLASGRARAVGPSALTA